MGTVDSVARLLALSAGNGSGGGEASNYNDLANKPQINGTTLTGNKTLDELGITADNLNVYTKEETTNVINDATSGKADKTALGNLSDLVTDDKSSAVAAINEIKEKGTKASNIDNLTITENENGTIQAVGVLNDKDKETLVKLWTGTKAEYDAIEEKDDATLYNITDDYEEPEIVANKTTVIDANSTDIQYPSAKAVYDKIKESAPDLSNYVQKTDYATYDNAGVLRANSSGFNVGTDGIPRAEQYDLDNYNKIPSNTFISKGTLENIKDDYVGTSEPINVLNDTLDNVIPKQTATDSIINVNDALKYKTFNFKVDGAYEQTTSDGSNLLDIDYSEFPKEQGELHIELNNDYSFTVTGTKTTTAWNNVNFNFKNRIHFKQGVTYYLHDITVFLEDADGSNIRNQSSTFTAEQDMYCEGSCYWTTNTPGVKNETVRPYLGTVPYDEAKYYKYTGGIASPNPDYPQEITTLSFNKIMTASQNLFDLNDVNQVTNNEKITTTVDKDDFIHVDIDNTGFSSETFANYWTNTSNKLVPNHDYLAVVEIKEYSGKGYNAFVGIESSTQFKSGLSDWNKKSGVITGIVTTKDGFENISTMLRTFIQCPANDKVSITYRISILADLTVTPDNFVYQPYKEDNYSIDLQDNEMVSLPNGVKDELQIDKEGNVSLIKNVGKKIFNGTEDGWWLNESNQFRIQLPGVISWGELLSNRFIEGANYEPGEMLAYVNNYIFFISDKLNVEDWKAWLQSNNVVVYYELIEPQTINLGKLEDLISTDEGSNTFVINGNIDTQISTTYALDLKKYVDNKISTVSQAVIEQE